MPGLTQAKKKKEELIPRGIEEGKKRESPKNPESHIEECKCSNRFARNPVVIAFRGFHGTVAFASTSDGVRILSGKRAWDTAFTRVSGRLTHNSSSHRTCRRGEDWDGCTASRALPCRNCCVRIVGHNLEVIGIRMNGPGV